ncbi:unnamed protein product [Taenia asiatica]|uniref:Fibronectin type-III domain-containing protein n=1 Tax=Taenia asiatica TaxID=60517 RepID=A0A0R3WAV5_TAEAS|nr:unnamed protein product [Taenia asiatica]
MQGISQAAVILNDEPLPPHFSWSFVSSTIIQLSWDVRRLAVLKAEELNMAVIPLKKNGTSKSVDFQLGEITFDELDPETTSTVIFEPIRNGTSIFIYRNSIKTLPEGSVTRKTHPLPHFYWIRMRYNTFSLLWSAKRFATFGIEQVNMSAHPTTGHGSTKFKTASVTAEEIILDGLMPDTLYEVKTEAIGSNNTMFYQLIYLASWPTGKSNSLCISCILFPVLNLCRCGGLILEDSTNNHSSLIAPYLVQPPTGRALSTTQIELTWHEPTSPNGILNPYIVACFDTASGGAPISVKVNDNKTTTTRVDGLQPNTGYLCRLEASTIPADGQSPADCVNVSVLSPPIRTMTTSESE